MSNNYPVDRSVINYIHARDYFPKGEIEALRPLVDDVSWVDKKFGKEMEHFNLIFQEIDIILGKMTGDLLEVDRPNSGTLRKTLHEVIHFEDFEDLNDWRFVVAMDANEFRTFIHKDGYKSFVDYLKDEKEDKPLLDYLDKDVWDEETVIKMKPNDVLFYRPWIFHSFQEGILHYYKLKVI
jgi:hypothetical protein